MLASVRIIAILRDDDPLLSLERERVAAWAPGNGWDYIEYVDAVDLLARLSDRSTESIEEIEIVAHGNPASVTMSPLATLEHSAIPFGACPDSPVPALSTFPDAIQDCSSRVTASLVR